MVFGGCCGGVDVEEICLETRVARSEAVDTLVFILEGEGDEAER